METNNKSPLLQDHQEIKAPVYNEVEQKYIGQLMRRLLNAQMERDKKHPELENKTYKQYYDDNERIANSWTEKKEFDEGVVVSSGTVEQKLFTVAAEINRLNLTPQVRVFDKNDNELWNIGVALSDAIDKTEKLELDKEQKLLRLVELLKQGTCFVQETWTKQFKKEKTLSTPFNGKINKAEWTTKIVKAFDGPKRKVLYAPGVYLGDIHCLTADDQPFMFTVKVTSYEELKSRYGQIDDKGNYVWERWASVSDSKVNLLTESNISDVKTNDGFSLLSLNEGQGEEIHYMDRFNDEYQIFLNGVAMLPVGFPLSAIFPGGKYPIEYQVLQPINPFFAYGRSFGAKTRRVSDLLDEVLRLLILKTRKSIHPPYANISGKVISSKSLMPGRITMGIDPNSLQPIGQESQGATAAEFQMYRQLQDNIDKNTISPQVQGQQSKSGTTAFEVNVLAKQAQKVISLLVFSASLLEQKIAYLRLDNVVGRWIDPLDQVWDDNREQLVSRFRNISRETEIDGRGMGTRQTVLTEGELPTSREVMDIEDFEGTPTPTTGRRKTRRELGMKPIQKIFMNPTEVKKARLVFFVEIDSKPEDTENNAKLAFFEELRGIQALISLGSRPNLESLEQEYAKVFKKRKEVMFTKQAGTESGVGAGNVDTAGLENVLNQNSAGASTVAVE